MLAEPTTHDLSHSSEPTGSAPSFQPVATARAKTVDEALARLADEVVDLANRERAAHVVLADTAPADYDTAPQAIEATALEASILDRFQMQSLIRADSFSGLADKGRAVLAYRETLEHCQVPEIQPLLLSMAEDAVRLADRPAVPLLAEQDAAVFEAAATVRLLSAKEHMQWNCDPALVDEDPRQIAWRAEVRNATDRFREAVAHLATLSPVTPAGLAAKAAAAPALLSFWDFVRSSWHESDLLQSIAADAQRMGAALAPLPTDAELLVLGAKLERLWDEEEEAAQGDDAMADAAVDRTRAIVDAIMSIQPTTIAGVKVRARAVAWGFNGEISRGAGTGEQLLHRFMTEMGALDVVPFRRPTEQLVPNVEAA